MRRIGMSIVALTLGSTLVTAVAVAAPVKFTHRDVTVSGLIDTPTAIAVDPAGDLFATAYSPVSGSVVALRANGVGRYGPAAILPFGTTLAGVAGLADDRAGDVFAVNEVM